jgi:hypothetical protein
MVEEKFAPLKKNSCKIVNLEIQIFFSSVCRTRNKWTDKICFRLKFAYQTDKSLRKYIKRMKILTKFMETKQKAHINFYCSEKYFFSLFLSARSANWIIEVFTTVFIVGFRCLGAGRWLIFMGSNKNYLLYHWDTCSSRYCRIISFGRKATTCKNNRVFYN